MSKEAPWHSKTMSLPGASLVGGDERVYHDNDACPVGQRIPAVRRNEGPGKDLKHCPTCAELGARSRQPHADDDRAAWIPALVRQHADGRFARLEGEACADYAAALTASWRLRPSSRRPSSN